MVNPSKAKGTKAETRVVNFLLAAGYSASRVALSGSQDKGDIHIVSRDGSYKICLEVKGGKQTQKVSRAVKEEWLAQTRKERAHAQASRPGFLVIAKHGASIPDYEVWSEDGRTFMYLDEFIEDSVINIART